MTEQIFSEEPSLESRIAATTKQSKKCRKVFNIFYGVFASLIFLFMGFWLQFEIRYVSFGVIGDSMKNTLNADGYHAMNIDGTYVKTHDSTAEYFNYDYVYVNKYAKGKRGDIVVFKHWFSSESAERLLVKRIIALPGDEINIVGIGAPTISGANNPPTYSDGYKLKIKYKGTSEFITLNESYITTDFIQSIIDDQTEPVPLTKPEHFLKKHFESLWHLKRKPDYNLSEGEGIKIPEKSFFALGDNRWHSTDSATEGPFLSSTIIGRVDFIVKYNKKNPNDNHFWQRLAMKFVLKF